VVLLVLGGCSFHDGAFPDAGGRSDTPAPTDAVPDADPSCVISGSSIHVPGGYIGGTGGSALPDVMCPENTVPIGLAFAMTQGTLSNHNNQRAAVDVHVRCGRVGRDAAGQMTSTPSNVVTRNGGNGGNCSSYASPQETAEVTCPAGQVLVGVTGNTPDGTLYNTVALQCAVLTPPATLSPTATSVAVAGTGSYTNMPQAASCPVGSGVIGFVVRAGCGQDQLGPICAPLTCQ
jgi:hypothetical protein